MVYAAQALQSGNEDCFDSEGQDLKPACSDSCKQACQATMDRYAQSSEAQAGLVIEKKDRERVVRSCERQCKYECSQPGTAFDFYIPYRT